MPLATPRRKECMYLRKQKQTNSVRKLIGATTDNGSRQLAFLPLLLATAKPGSNDISSKNSHCANDPQTMAPNSHCELCLFLAVPGFAGTPQRKSASKPVSAVEHCFVLLDVFFVESVVDCFSVPFSSCPLDMCDQ